MLYLMGTGRETGGKWTDRPDLNPYGLDDESPPGGRIERPPKQINGEDVVPEDWHTLQRKYPQLNKKLKGKRYVFIPVSDDIK